jgi:hypothetical protein
MSDKIRVMWSLAFAWLKLFVAWNWKKYTLYLITLIASAATWGVQGCNNPDNPPYVPPIPEPDVPPLPNFDDLGWIRTTRQQQEEFLKTLDTPYFADTPAGKADMHDVFENTPDALTYRLANRGRSMTGQRPYPVRNQGRLGICVGCGAAAACEYAMGAAAALKKGPAQELPLLSEEAIYGFSRWEVHGNRRPQGLVGDGSVGAWAAKALTQKGILERKKYPSVDLTTYTEVRGREWGDRGVPDELEPIAAQQTAIGCALVKTTDELRKAHAQGYAAFICSQVGFGETLPVTRDSDGFLPARGSWAHCMASIGYRGGSRPGFLILNSWGPNWVKGPVGPYSDIPDGSFWCDVPTMQRILDQGDSWAVSGVKGFPRRKIAIDDWIAGGNKLAEDASVTVRMERDIGAFNRNRKQPVEGRREDEEDE